MRPTFEQTVEKEILTNKSTTKKESSMIMTFQLWRKNGSCPAGTIPIRRIREKDLLNFNSPENYGTKGPSFPNYVMKSNGDKGDSQYLDPNRSVNSGGLVFVSL